MRRAPPVHATPVLLSVAILLATGLAGCSGASFTVSAPVWKAGYAWVYDVDSWSDVKATGTVHPDIELPDDDVEIPIKNDTVRLEVFNATAYSVEGIPIYALAKWVRFQPGDNDSRPAESRWSAHVYSEFLNEILPTYLDWRNQEVQVSGSEGGATATAQEPNGTEDPEASPTDSFNHPESELRRLDWPLTRGHRWFAEEPIPDLNTVGQFEGRALRLATVSTPAGKFSGVILQGRLEPFDVVEAEVAMKRDFERDGGEVTRIDFAYAVEYKYSYSEAVRNLAEYQKTTRVTLAARGVTGSGEKYDFTYEAANHEKWALRTFQLAEGVEKPLSFALDVIRGAYEPKPITPNSHLAVEILATSDRVNRMDEQDRLTLGVRIYNSSAGEKKLRGLEASYPKVGTAGEFNPKYNHDELFVEWILYTQNSRGAFVEHSREIGDQVAITGKRFDTAGIKMVEASLQTKPTQTQAGFEIFRDQVRFEVFSYHYVNYTREFTNVTPDQRFIFARFPVDVGAVRLVINAQVVGQPSDTWCPVGGGGGGPGGGGQNDCLRVTDAGSRTVQDDRADRMKFESSRVIQFSPGSWLVSYEPVTAPGQKVMFEILVRYRVGA